MKKTDFIAYLKDADFGNLFRDMGYDNPSNLAPVCLDFDFDEQKQQFDFVEIAQKSSFKIFRCDVASVPSASLRKKIDHKLRRYAENYIAIYVIPETEHHLWVIPVKSLEKRDLVTVEYDEAKKAEFLAQKMDALSFEVDQEVTITDVTSIIQKEFAINSEKITKDFYTGFRKQHESFAKFINGIDVEGDRQWYVSVMLNRLMFCYFIQKKGFLNFDTHYLRNKLEWCRENKGKDKYFSFYKGFLKVLFHGGLNAPSKKRQAEFERTYGKIPYLNGGLFDEHQIERDYKDIDIKDEAFESLFDFFDKWNWHLDTRISASGRDINPDVLGYIFEQYINDRAQMGAYYTKEDITEYIGKNCIIPFVMNKVQGSLNKTELDFIWDTLAQSGDTYIYDAVKKGVDLPLPDYIECGVDTTKPKLLERRSRWNEKADEAFALPTEIWRETVERRERCRNLRKKISSHEISDINDFITYNLDIRKFAEELIATTPSENFVGQAFDALQNVTILDPTCGSGAFLFAGMNILEPLYERCIDRMEDFNKKNGAFKKELDEIKNKYRSNIQYFIYKSIILRNLYGVDIMHEATEIAKLRLFLKMVAVVDVDKRAENLGLDPLPDIDFNVRCGNTLVGFANEKELERSFEGDWIEAAKKDAIDAEMAEVADTFNEFRRIQLTPGGDLVAFKEAKSELKSKLTKLNKTLDKKLFATNGMGKKFDEWKKDAQPFHWLSEFYQIIHENGGFDVIIGNPPYVEYNKKDSKTKKAVSDIYKLNGDDGKTPCAYKTLDCGNLYTFCVERSKKIVGKFGFFGMIVPISVTCTQRMQKVQDLILSSSITWLSNYAERPGKLFTGAEVLLTIFISRYSQNAAEFTTGFIKWRSDDRDILFKRINYNKLSSCVYDYVQAKTSIELENSILKKLKKQQALQFFMEKESSHRLFYRIGGGRYWKIFTSFSPKFILNGKESTSSRENYLYFRNESDRDVAITLLSSSLFYWFFIMTTNCRDLNPSDLKNFPFTMPNKENSIHSELVQLSIELMKEYKNKSVLKEKVSQKTGNITYQEFYPRLSKPIIDEIDKVLAKHYGFTEEELDFIINYDIKYRMGDELTQDEE